MPPTSAQLGTAIRHLRTERDRSLESVAAGADMHWTYLSGIERGLRNPTWKILVAIATSLDVKVSEIVLLAEQAASTAGRAR